MQVYVVSMGWISNCDFGHRIEKIFTDKKRADEYAAQRFDEELHAGRFVECEPDEIAVAREYLQAWIIHEGEYFEFVVAVAQVE